MIVKTKRTIYLIMTGVILFSLLGSCDQTTSEDTSDDTSDDTATVTIVNAATPEITTQPISASYDQNETASALSISATVSDDGAVSYQWYSASTEDGDGSEIASATSASYTPRLQR